MKTLLALLLLSASVATAATEEKLAKTFAVAPGGSLVVEVAFGSIEVVADPARTEVGVEVWRKISRLSTADEENYLKENPVEFIQNADTVTIRARAKATSGWSWIGGSLRNEARYTVRVPGTFNANLKTSGGAIELTGIEGSVTANTSGGGLRFTNVRGPIAGHTSGGSIKAIDCRGTARLGTSGGGIEVSGGGGELRGDTSGGSITVKNFDGPAAVETSGGGITLEAIRGKLHGSTSGGSIRATLSSPLSGDVDLSTSGGGITVTAAPDAAFNLDAATSGGGVDCALPVTVEGKIKRDQLKGSVNGGGPGVHLRTSGGGIHVRKS